VIYLLPTQPELRRGVWTRPELSTTKPGSALHIKFTPGSTNKTDEFNHVGFKGRFWVTNSPPDNWHDKALESKEIISSTALISVPEHGRLLS